MSVLVMYPHTTLYASSHLVLSSSSAVLGTRLPKQTIVSMRDRQDTLILSTLTFFASPPPEPPDEGLEFGAAPRMVLLEEPLVLEKLRVRADWWRGMNPSARGAKIASGASRSNVVPAHRANMASKI